MRRPALRDLVFLPGELLALAIPFLPINNAVGFVPLPAAFLGAPIFLGWLGLQQFILVPLLLGSAMAASTVRQAVAGPLSRLERIGAYAVAFAVLTATGFLSVHSDLGPVIGPTFLLAAIGVVVVLAATRKGRVPQHVHAHLAFLSAWIVNAGFTVVFMLTATAGPGAGAWVAAASVVMVAVEAVVRVRRALRSEGEGEAAEKAESS